jgi:hypothetical protein
MDQAEPQGEDILRELGECREDTGLGGDIRVCFGGDSQEKAKIGAKPLHNPANF